MLRCGCGRGVKYHEPEYWKFGEEGNKYFRHATGQIYAISKDLAAYISINLWVQISLTICIYFQLYWFSLHLTVHIYWSGLFFLFSWNKLGRPILHRYANEDVSLGSWFIGLEVEQVDDRSMCCGTPPGTQFQHGCALIMGLVIRWSLIQNYDQKPS